MDNVNATAAPANPFNSPVEVGLRAMVVLTASYPVAHSLQRLTVLDYLVVHSDDVPDGPRGLHPRTPYRAGELLLRRGVLEEGLLLYASRALVERRFERDGVFYAATEGTASFLDVLTGQYVHALRDRAAWLIARFESVSDDAFFKLVNGWVGEWGAEFTGTSLLSEGLA